MSLSLQSPAIKVLFRRKGSRGFSKKYLDTNHAFSSNIISDNQKQNSRKKFFGNDDKKILTNFIDLLYAAAIAMAFSSIPVSPLQHKLGLLVFFSVLLFIADDWYKYHDSEKDIHSKKAIVVNFIAQVIIILALNRMLVHSFDNNLKNVLGYAVVIQVIDFIWNLSTSYEKRFLYIATSAIQGVGFYSLIYFHDILSQYYGEILIFGGAVALWFLNEQIEQYYENKSS